MSAVKVVAQRRPTPAQARHQCSNARGELTGMLDDLGITDYRLIEVEGPRGSTRPIADLHPAHQVLGIGVEVVDVTWMQIDTEAAQPWKVYPSLEALREDWSVICDWVTGEEIR